MQISDLARRSGVPVATVKYYLREGLLHAGEATSATRAAYDEDHLRRLLLIRALASVARLRLDQIRDVLAAVDDERASLHSAIGSAHTLLSAGPEPTASSRRKVGRLLRSWGWRVAPRSRNRDGLARALGALDDVGHSLSDAALADYAAAMRTVATTDLDALPTGTREDAVESAVVGTVLVDPVLTALRRLAQEDVSARRFARSGRVRTGRRSPG